MSIRIALLSAAVLAVLSQAAAAEQTHQQARHDRARRDHRRLERPGQRRRDRLGPNEVELTPSSRATRTELEFEATERQVRIKVDRPDHGGIDDDEDDATLTLKVPKGARLIVDTVSADITVDGVRGEQRLESVSGEVETKAYDQPVVAARGVGRHHRRPAAAARRRSRPRTSAARPP